MSAYLHQCCDAPRWRCEQCHAPATWAENQYLTAQEPSAMPSTLERLIEEMRTIALVAGQCSVEGPEDVTASMAAAESARASRWADALSALRPSEGPPSTTEIIVEREIDEILHALGTKSFERVRAESTVAILAALRRPSEGPPKTVADKVAALRASPAPKTPPTCSGCDQLMRGPEWRCSSCGTYREASLGHG